MRRFLLTVSAVLSLSIAAGTVTEDAQAFRGQNPFRAMGWGTGAAAPFTAGWNSNNVTRAIYGQGGYQFPAEGKPRPIMGSPEWTAHNRGVSNIQRARMAWQTLPKLRALGTLAVAATAFDIGWKIGRTIDTKYLHLAGNIGTEDVTWTTMVWTFSTAWSWGSGWALSMSGTYTNRITVPWPLDNTLCTASGSGNFSSGTNCGSQWSEWRAYQLKQVDVVTNSDGAEFRNDPTVTACGAGSVGRCRVVFFTEIALEHAIMREPLQDWTTQTTHRTTNITMPADPGLSTGPLAGEASAALLEDDGTQAPGSAGETYTSSHSAGQLADPNVPFDPTPGSPGSGDETGTSTTTDDWEGEALPTFTMPNCEGMTLAECISALEAAGHLGTITELELDIATADVTLPAGAVVFTAPTPGTTGIDQDEEVFITLNPDPMPILVPEPLFGETYTAYITRLQALGWVGTATTTELTDATGDPALGPLAPVTIKLPAIGTIPETVLRIGVPFPAPLPRITTTTDIEITHNPTTYPPVTSTPGPGSPPASAPNTPPAVDFTPLTDLEGLSCGNPEDEPKFPFAFLCYAIEVTTLFDVDGEPPTFVFDGPSVEVGSIGYNVDGQYIVSLHPYTEYVAYMRSLISFVLWIGGVYLLASNLFGFRHGGDPGETADEALTF